MLQPEVGGSRENFFFAGIDNVRFRKPVVAGGTLVMRMTLIKLQKHFGIAKMEGKAEVGVKMVCQRDFFYGYG
ncbi:thioesterase superfamily protein [Actinidia rufa]|uniref:Thioesterase superfamily protein n=1 Tax=Actinidia rufa TaxID=165716 RepID=A0A7J0ESR7_9ERIC|nr:thioesterase superfamily protein [Actinidia rufa]